MPHPEIAHQEEQKAPPASHFETSKRDDDDAAAAGWKRIIAARAAECDQLPWGVVRSLLSGRTTAADNEKEESVESVLTRYVKIGTDTEARPSDRRDAFRAVQSILARIDQHAKRPAPLLSVAPTSLVGATHRPTQQPKTIRPTGHNNNIVATRTRVLTPDFLDPANPAPTVDPNQSLQTIIASDDIDTTTLATTATIVNQSRHHHTERSEHLSTTNTTVSQTRKDARSEPAMLDTRLDSMSSLSSTSNDVMPLNNNTHTSNCNDRSGIIHTPGPNDVLDSGLGSFGGNVQFRTILRQHIAAYTAATCSMHRIDVIRAIIGAVKDRGGRFLKVQNQKNHWVERSSTSTVNKVEVILMNEARKEQSHHRPLAATQPVVQQTQQWVSHQNGAHHHYHHPPNWHAEAPSHYAPPAYPFVVPRANDVLSADYFQCNEHPGNVQIRHWINELVAAWTQAYRHSNYSAKREAIESGVADKLFAKQGRFLKYEYGGWVLVDRLHDVHGVLFRMFHEASESGAPPL